MSRRLIYRVGGAARPYSFDEYFSEVHGTIEPGLADAPEVSGGSVHFLAPGCFMEQVLVRKDITATKLVKLPGGRGGACLVVHARQET